ncbi:siderophore-interacting protein [Corynebacterium propinquum]|uniref:siderophore-interacting protein n=1 Tax=Corynebacterium propinquum TaxID=43769 RepID=UPI002670A29C|nr:siderophore-interacting protein [Corynebacterium propinquum]WKS31438.1 siderophore-interacting protein [Corynebacterium propinquum]WKS35784.1 siderophore-interacting protein [Corynebacterium propinquum]WKS37769.1 siderophore-interacting protein [Corynebacterium propinquum]WKS42124.1 siderophore-interacting protein [Corynebacterium propinquum]WKS46298.1 siderophore-interacting protein [Corynebacterium propinquum]
MNSSEMNTTAEEKLENTKRLENTEQPVTTEKPETSEKPKKKRQVREATVTGRTQLSRTMVRLSFSCPSLAGGEFPFTDHYVKLLFAPAGADYSWPFDVEEIKKTQPREHQPVRRTYTFRRIDPATGDFEIDFVVHGEHGVAGVWAQNAKIGERIGFLGPGGKWHPSDSYEHFVLAGDEAAAPAIAAALENLPDNTTADVYLEIPDAECTVPMPEPAGANLHWVLRDGRMPGTALVSAIREADYPAKRTSWFVHGVAEMIKDVRKFLYVDGNVAKEDTSISGYWRLRMTEDEWQASKMEFNQSVEDEERALRSQRK